MELNKVATWEGRIEWIDRPRTGTSKKGKPWSSVDFVLKYTDEQDNERFIMFNVFGNEKVDTVCACKQGTLIRVDWRPDAREYNGRWFGKLEAYGITVVSERELAEKSETELPKEAPIFPRHEEDPDSDLPFR